MGKKSRRKSVTPEGAKMYKENKLQNNEVSKFFCNSRLVIYVLWISTDVWLGPFSLDSVGAQLDWITSI